MDSKDAGANSGSIGVETALVPTEEEQSDKFVLKESKNEESEHNDSKNILQAFFGYDDNIPLNPDEIPIDLTFYACTVATHPATNIVVVAVTLLLAVMLAVTKVTILSTIMTDAFMIRCTKHDHCEDGTFCAPFTILFAQIMDPSELVSLPYDALDQRQAVCYDCASAYHINEKIIDGAQESSPIMEFIAGVYDDPCENDIPDSCDYIQSNRERMSRLTVVLFLLIWAMLSMLIHYDLQKAQCLRIFVEKRLSMNKSASFLRNCGIRFLYWILFTTNAFLIPCWMTSATANLLISWPPETRSLIIVPLEIGLIANFDDVGKFLFLGKSHEHKIQHAVKGLGINFDDFHASKHNNESGMIFNMSEERIMSRVNRLFSYVLSAVTFLLALDAEGLFSKTYFMNAFVGFQEEFLAYDPCPMIMVTGIFLPIIVTAPFAFFWGCIRAKKSFSSKQNIETQNETSNIVTTSFPRDERIKNWISRFFALLNIPASFCLVVYSWLPIRIFIIYLQFQKL